METLLADTEAGGPRVYQGLDLRLQQQNFERRRSRKYDQTKGYPGEGPPKIRAFGFTPKCEECTLAVNVSAVLQDKINMWMLMAVDPSAFPARCILSWRLCVALCTSTSGPLPSGQGRTQGRPCTQGAWRVCATCHSQDDGTK